MANGIIIDLENMGAIEAEVTDDGGVYLTATRLFEDHADDVVRLSLTAREMAMLRHGLVFLESCISKT